MRPAQYGWERWRCPRCGAGYLRRPEAPAPTCTGGHDHPRFPPHPPTTAVPFPLATEAPCP